MEFDFIGSLDDDDDVFVVIMSSSMNLNSLKKIWCLHKFIYDYE